MTLELIGVVGLYRPGWVLAGALIVGCGIGFALRRPLEGIPLPSPQVAPIALGVAVAVRCWSPPTGRCRPRRGSTSACTCPTPPGTTPRSRPASSRTTRSARSTSPRSCDLTVWFYPQNSELLHSAGVLFLGNDFLSPLINIGWMALCLLAAWTFGRPYGAAATAVLGVALVVDAHMLLLYQPGDAKNDIGGALLPARVGGDLRQPRGAARAAARSARPIGGGAGPRRVSLRERTSARMSRRSPGLGPHAGSTPAGRGCARRSPAPASPSLASPPDSRSGPSSTCSRRSRCSPSA